MKIYFAVFPGGNQSEGEQRIIKMGGQLRLASFHYLKQLIITIQEIYKEKGKNKCPEEKQINQQE